MKTRTAQNAALAGIILLATLALSPLTRAATVVWNGPATTNTANNWTSGGNWAGGTPPTSVDDAKFYDFGAIPGVSNINNTVDVTTNIASLQYGNTNNIHTTLVADGVTLNVTGAGGLVVGTPGDVAVAKNLTNTITGLAGTLSLNNSSATIALNQGTATSVSGTRANLDLSGLGTFSATVSRLGIGSTLFANPGSANQREAGLLVLARTNVIALSYTDTLANYQTANKNNALEMSRNPGNNAGILSILLLGITNYVTVDSIGAGRDKASAGSAAWMGFNPAFLGSSPSAVFRGVGGGTARVTWWAVGDMNANASSAQVSVGTNDFTGGTVDAMVDVLSLARDCSPSHTATTSIFGVLTFGAGTIDVNTIYAGNQSLGPSTSVAPNVGIINVNGPGTLRVNTSLVLGFTTQTTSAAALSTRGVLNVRNGGMVLANTITCGAASTNNLITLTNGTLIITNTVGTPAKAVTAFNMTNSTLQLFIAASAPTNICVTNLTIGGATNVIQILSVPVFASYPKQIPLISYAGTIGGVGYNFGLGATTLPATAPGGYLSNNVANKTVDLYLPYDPRPVFTGNPASYSGAPGDNVNFSVAVDPNSVTPLSYQWYRNGVALTDGATGNGSTLSGATASTLTITSAQPADSANTPGYTCTVTNIYGSASSAAATLTISAGDIPPSITGLTNQTVIASNNATLVTSVSGSPIPTTRWQFNGNDLSDGPTGNGDTISGGSSSTLTITSVQYPSSQGTYSIIASNIAGQVTNSMTLTVIVRPSISAQPTNLTVLAGNSATFYVTASGVPAPGYTWKKNGSPIPGATASSYTIATVAASDIATYSVTVTNAAGTLDSSNATLIVTSPMTATTLAPANSATGVCYDTPFYITFSQTPVLRTSGKIRIYDSANPATPVETIDLSQNTGPGVQPRSNFQGDAQGFNYYPVVITGNTAAIYPHSSSGLLTSNKTYFVNVDVGAFADTSGNYFSGINDSSTWSITTKPTGPVDPVNPVVKADGSGDFVTVQGAVDSLSPTGPLRRTITVKNGTYFEIVNVGKSNVTIRGQSRSGTFINYPNNANIAPGGTTHARMTFKVNTNDVAIENLTITNSTPQGGSQAEALMIESNARRCIVNNAEIASRQDTILANVNSSQAYFYNVKIVGNFDYIWGGGNLFFSNCVIRTISGAGGPNLTAARTDTSGSASASTPWVNPNGATYSANGFSFVGCTLQSDSGVSSITLAGNNGTAGGLDSWAFCKIDNAAYITPTAALSNSYVFWQYQNTDLGGVNPVTFANVQTIGVTNNDTRLQTATNVTAWFYGWSPQLLPNILSQPANQSINAGQNASFSVSATGVPDPTYQWQHAGTNLPGATSATLNINNAQAADAGSYSVIVSNTAGAVTSSMVTLTVNLPPVPGITSVETPQDTPIALDTNKLVLAATDPENDPFNVTAAGPSSTNGGTVALGGGYVTYTPVGGYVGPDEFTYTLTDSGGASSIATVSVTVTSTNASAQNQVGGIVMVGGFPQVTFAGIPGRIYSIQRTTSMVTPDWTTIGSALADGQGRIVFTDLTPPMVQAYYRTTYP